MIEKSLILRLNKKFLLSIKVFLILASLYFFITTYQWMVFEKYQIHGNIRGIDSQVDKQLGLDKVTDLSLEYEQAWINSEKKFNTSLGTICIALAIILSLFKPGLPSQVN